MFMQSKQNIQLNQKAIKTEFENYSNDPYLIHVSPLTVKEKSFPMKAK